ncbi:LysR substrate-binding domain-containing protein [Oceaniserpentilla sp. 4NH20-0058]|uniref:LysR family transcriptional regulator n=1 Tax=Oceaniserpentilla sp. 4NH20-0058 TaxID=3127660 RepID=UPI003101E477
MSTWEGISEFVYVAELASFTHAAQKLGVSVAQVSRLVSDLETRLATKLLYRTTRKVSLTAEGEIYYQHCRQLLSGLEDAERALSNLKSSPQGTIKLTAPVMYGEKYIMPLVHDFMLKHKEVDVIADLTNQQLDLINGGYDLAIRLGKLKDSSMMAKPLSRRRYIVCASPAYLAHHGTPHSLTELTQHNCLAGQHTFWRFENNNKEKTNKISGTITCNSGYGLVDAALKGIGIVQLPNYYVDQYLNSGELIEVLGQFQIPQESIWAVYPHNRHLSAKVRQLVTYLQLKLEDPTHNHLST